jgi:hypothetical protein
MISAIGLNAGLYARKWGKKDASASQSAVIGGACNFLQ